jgi:MoaA/NifB/PqqE/SkfB family radical SAM enzyme
MPRVATIDYHVTSECNEECVYCWGPQGIEEVDTETAAAIVARIAECGARRIVFTGGDPLKRHDIGSLVRLADDIGLEVAVSTTGDELTAEFLDEYAAHIALISLPLDGPNEEVSSRTKKAGHFTAVMAALDMLARHPAIDVKVATAVTRCNIAHVPDIVALLDARAAAMPNRLFYNVFQAFPRSMNPEVSWEEYVVSLSEFAELAQEVGAASHLVRVNWLNHETLDKLYVMVFPDGTLTIPVGGSYASYGRLLEIEDLDVVLEQASFDVAKHLRHAEGWQHST